jgi:hypothetical protein
MFLIMIFSYAIFSYVDLKATFSQKDKKGLVVYFALMTISCIIGTASGYVKNMPSPAEPIKQLVLGIVGK